MLDGIGTLDPAYPLALPGAIMATIYHASGEPNLISHLSIGVSDLAKSTDFYDKVLAVLGYARVFTGPVSVGYGPPGGPEGLALKLYQPA